MLYMTLLHIQEGPGKLRFDKNLSLYLSDLKFLVEFRVQSFFLYI